MHSSPDLQPVRGRRRRLLLGAVGFVLLTLGVFYYQFAGIAPGAERPDWANLRWAYLAILLACIPIEALSCALRAWVTTRILDARVTFWTCLKGEWANVAISTLTPTQSWGGPGQVYMLRRGGASLGTAVTIMLTGFAGTLIALLTLSCYALLVTRADGAWPLFLVVVGSFVGCSVTLGCVAWQPGLLRVPVATLSRSLARLRGRQTTIGQWWPPGEPRTGVAFDRMGPVAAAVVDAVYTYRADVARMVRRGKAAFAAVCVLSVPFPIGRALIAYACVRFLGVEASDFRHIFEAQILLTLFEFFAPSPGGAGVIEMASSALMGHVVAAGYVPYYTLLWRASTLYLPALAGFACLAWAFVADARRFAGPAPVPAPPVPVPVRGPGAGRDQHTVICA
jgi:glycosyltransferase 2 family protein